MFSVAFAEREDGSSASRLISMFMPRSMSRAPSTRPLFDLSAIDANAATSADDAFTFIGTGAFSNRAGEVRYELVNGQAHIYVDVDGDARADMQIVAATQILVATDFVL